MYGDELVLIVPLITQMTKHGICEKIQKEKDMEFEMLCNSKKFVYN